MPLCWLPIIAFHAQFLAGPHLVYYAPISASLPSGRNWGLDIGSVLLLASIALLIISAFRRGRGSTVPTPVLMTAVLMVLIFLFEFLFIPFFGTNAFFMLILCMMLELGVQSISVPRH